MSKATTISLADTIKSLTFLPDRTPSTEFDEVKAAAFAQLSEYRDGGIFVGHYAGDSEWERHSKGDEIVYVIEGETCLILLTEAGESRNTLKTGELLVVPQNVWHRFETPKPMKVMTVTPQPTDHSVDQPSI